MIRQLAFPLSSLVVLLLATLSSAQGAKPNVVLVMADDMGYGDVQAYNRDSSIPTPNLNQLAADGMRFTDAHTPSSVCTPTRYALLTGRYCWRTRLKRGVLNGYGEPLIDQQRTTMADMLRSEGYKTGVVGKWHLGLGFAKGADGKFDFSQPVSDSPKEHGFEFSHVIPASLDFPPYVYIRNGEITEFPKLTQPAQKFPAFLRKGERSPDFVMEDCLDDLTTVACDWIGEQGKTPQPFFLYFPLTAPHKPVLPHPRFQGRTKLGPYGDFVHQVDATVGRVLEAIDDAGVRETTIVIYTSDNGSFMYRLDAADAKGHVDDESVQGYRADRHRANGPLRGTKADIWEAGHRVPFLVRWPKQVKAGSTCDSTICLTDVFATLAEIASAKLDDDTAPDSFSMAPLLAGKSWQRAPVIHHSVGGMFAIRDGDWKLVAGDGSGGRQKPRGKPFARPFQLFNLQTDLGERNNVIERNDAVAKRLEQQLTKIRESGRSR